MKTDRPDWSARLADIAGELTLLIEDFEQDLVTRKCIVEVKAGDLSWVRYGKDKNWRIFRGEKPLTEAPLLERAQYGAEELESLADAADTAMETLMAGLVKQADGI